MSSVDDKYSEYVDHPRYGRGPNYTGLNPDPLAPEVQLNSNSTSIREIRQRYQALTGEKWPYGGWSGDVHEIKRIPNTAIVADLSRQYGATVPVTHYFDLDRICRDCGRRFIFFAIQQKYWYEELGFNPGSDCVRCLPCRQRKQEILRPQRRLQRRYEELCHVHARSTDDNLELAGCCLSLIECSVFSPKQLQHVRTLLNRIRTEADERTASRYNELLTRVRSIEAQKDE